MNVTRRAREPFSLVDHFLWTTAATTVVCAIVVTTSYMIQEERARTEVRSVCQGDWDCVLGRHVTNSP